MSERVDVAVVGAGILGLAFAWEAARQGKRVVVVERDNRAQGASIRNFGMVWPIGQPPGAMYATALQSRERWLELKDVVRVEPCGSVHAAYEADEDAVLREFAEAAPGLGVQCEYMPTDEAAARFPHLEKHGLLGVLWSSTECVVDPREVIATLPRWLAEAHGVRFHFGTTVTRAESGRITTSDGQTILADQVFVASGVDFQTLFPDVYAGLGLRVCKLQMLRTAPQPHGWKLGPHLAGGLTLTHYNSFGICPSLAALKTRVLATMPEYVKYGIHVMASQNGLGEVVIGDSHEYDADISIFNNDRIDSLILDYLGRMLKLPDPKIAARWHGMYAKHPTRPICVETPQPGVTLLAAPGGAGMTLSFGFARAWWDAHTAGRNFQPEA